MATISSSVGLVSGINTGDIINQLMAIESRPKDLLQSRMDSLSQQKLAFTDLSTRLTSLRINGQALVYERMFQSPESPLRLSLCCAVLARQRMIFVSQKATELGIERFQPVLTERSVPPEGLEHEKSHAWPGQEQ